MHFSVLVCAMLLFVSDVDCADNGFLFWMEGENRPPGLVETGDLEPKVFDGLEDDGQNNPFGGTESAAGGLDALGIALNSPSIFSDVT